MNLDELRSAQAKERRKDSLQHLRDSFYDDVGAYVADLRAARDRRAEQVENPFADDDVRRLSDEVETAEEVAEALYERRVGKVVKLASFAAADMSVDEEGMTTEERRLFEDLVERITANKSEVLDVLAGESPVTDGTQTAGGASAAADGSTASDAPTTAESPVSREPEPTDPVPETEDPAADADTSDPLAGAMGGDDPVSSGDAGTAGGASPGPTETDPGPAAPDPTGGTAADAADAGPADADDAAVDGDEDPTPVPPEPAPPGAVGVDGASDDADEEAGSGASTDGGPVPEATAGGESPAGAEPAGSRPNDDAERATVRITRDVGAIFGVDEREYELASEDVVSLPVENADPLVQRDAAERID